MKFSEVLDALKEGKALTNARLSYKGGFIVRQVPQSISKEIIPKMTSLPEEAKQVLKDRGDIHFHDQVLLFLWSPMQEAHMVTSYIPTWYDIFDETWTIL